MASFDENGKYIKTNWKAGDKITATKLNKIEESIEAVNDNDISRHVEADARLDALEAKDVAHDKEFTNVKNLIADNKAAAELGDYEINSRMQFLEQELNEGIEEVHNVAETVDGKIATAEANMTAQVNTAKDEMTAQVNQGKADMEAMVAEVEADLEGLHAKDEELTSQLADNKNKINSLGFNVKTHDLIGVGQHNSISQVFPDVTLEDVQKLNSNATLNHSADWYAIQKAVYENDNVFIPSGDYIIDMPIICYKELTSVVGSRRTTIKGVFDGTIINVIGDINAIECNSVTILEGLRFESNRESKNGLFVSAKVIVKECGFNGFGEYGIKFDDNVYNVHSLIERTTVYGNCIGGIYCMTNIEYQKTSLRIDKCYIVGNGDCESDEISIENGRGLKLGACLGVSVTDTVVEYNHGAGIEICNSGVYGVFNVNVIGCYFEGNRYANIYVNNDDTTLMYKEIFIKGNYYSAYPMAPNFHEDSLLNESTKTYIKNPECITDSIIDNKIYDMEVFRLEENFVKQDEIIKTYKQTYYPSIGTVESGLTKIIDIDDQNILKDGFIDFSVGAVIPYGIVIQLISNPSIPGRLNLYVSNLSGAPITIDSMVLRVRQTYQ